GLWLNESFATYMANLELERASDFENTWDAFYSGTKQWAYQTDQLVTTHPIELAVPTTADAFTNFDGITYGKGASVLKQLPYFLGEENFRRGVSNYLKKYAYQNTSLDDFVSELGLAANMNLDQWQQQWLYQSGLNTVEANFACENGTLGLMQLFQYVPEVSSADKTLRQQRTQLGLYHYTETEMILTDTIAVTYSGPVTNVTDAIGLPCPDLVFPNENDWAYMKVQLDERSLQTLFEHINDFSDATIRIMLWQSLWDSVQDTAMPLTDFVDFAFNNISSESDPNIIRQVAGNLSSAFSLLTRIRGNDALRSDYSGRIEQFMLAQLRAADSGSEQQKIWFDNFVNRAHSTAALDFLASLLAGTTQLPGLTIDQDKRWAIIITLNRYQHDDHVALLAAERMADTSDQGLNMALAAEAIRPLAEIKQTWLDTIIDSPDTYKLATLRSTMGYLFPAEQRDLMDQFATRMMQVIPDINASATQEYMGEYVNYLIPATCSPQSVERLAAANAQFAGFQPLIVKAYRIARQRDQRCVNIGMALP
ncbi:MAG: ERAP1-like C-terminal domain-containing protein, partial [Pseudohongiellaceae bacterium]